MSEFQAVLDELQNRIDAIGPANWIHNGRPADLQLVVLMAANGQDLCQQISDIIGNDRGIAFYKGYSPDGAAPAFHFFGTFARLLPSCCSAVGEGKVAFDREPLATYLDQYAAMVRSGVVDYQFVLRLVNITISADFEIAKGIVFRKISPAVVFERYPPDPSDFRHPLEHMYVESWPKHCVEVVADFRGTAAEFQQHFRLERQHALINSIVHSFLLSGVAEECPPRVSHVSQLSDLESNTMYRGLGGFCFDPYLLTDADITLLRETYAYLQYAKSDPVLHTAIDRFILGKRQEMHNPNMVNEPHWDKVVDYVIAMESLFTTVEGHAVQGEPTYRFSINGASVLSQATSESAHVLYKALKHLYGVRSSVVHGGALGEVPDAANKFIRVLGIDNEHHQHAIGRLLLVCKKVEEWLRKVFFHLCKMPVADRPYRKPGGWEELLWGKLL
jgi:hypothetical protein